MYAGMGLSVGEFAVACFNGEALNGVGAVEDFLYIPKGDALFRHNVYELVSICRVAHFILIPPVCRFLVAAGRLSGWWLAWRWYRFL